MIKKLILLLVLVVLSSSFVAAGSVVRTFDTAIITPGSEVEVTLGVTYNAVKDRLIIEENYPTTFTVVNSGGLDNSISGILRLVQFSGTFLPTITYTLRAPDDLGTYDFSGSYILTGMTVFPIEGTNRISVIESYTPPAEIVTSCNDNQIIETCRCNTPLEDVGGKCSSVITAIKTALDSSTMDTVQKISAIAHALKLYIASS